MLTCPKCGTRDDHIKHGITYPFSVHADEPSDEQPADWVGWAA